MNKGWICPRLCGERKHESYDPNYNGVTRLIEHYI